MIFFSNNTIFSFDIFIHPEVYMVNQKIFDERIPKLEMIVNSIGGLICNKLIEAKRISLTELFQWFQEEFPDVPKENLKKDIEIFLQTLNNKGIINYTFPITYLINRFNSYSNIVQITLLTIFIVSGFIITNHIFNTKWEKERL